MLINISYQGIIKKLFFKKFSTNFREVLGIP